MILGYWVFDRLKDQPDISIKGDFRPKFLATSFTIRNAFVIWREKIEANADKLKVNYSFFELLKDRQIHVTLTSEQVRAELKGEWKSLAPVAEQIFKDVVAEVSFKEGKLNEIYQINAQSKDVHLKFGLSNRVEGH